MTSIGDKESVHKASSCECCANVPESKTDSDREDTTVPHVLAVTDSCPASVTHKTNINSECSGDPVESTVCPLANSLEGELTDLESAKTVCAEETPYESSGTTLPV